MAVKALREQAVPPWRTVREAMLNADQERT